MSMRRLVSVILVLALTAMFAPAAQALTTEEKLKEYEDERFKGAYDALIEIMQGAPSYLPPDTDKNQRLQAYQEFMAKKDGNQLMQTVKALLPLVVDGATVFPSDATWRDIARSCELNKAILVFDRNDEGKESYCIVDGVLKMRNADDDSTRAALPQGVRAYSDNDGDLRLYIGNGMFAVILGEELDALYLERDASALIIGGAVRKVTAGGTSSVLAIETNIKQVFSTDEAVILLNNTGETKGFFDKHGIAIGTITLVQGRMSNKVPKAEDVKDETVTVEYVDLLPNIWDSPYDTSGGSSVNPPSQPASGCSCPSKIQSFCGSTCTCSCCTP